MSELSIGFWDLQESMCKQINSLNSMTDAKLKGCVELTSTLLSIGFHIYKFKLLRLLMAWELIESPSSPSGRRRGGVSVDFDGFDGGS
ncbi:hypothetical protein FNV43_RR02316 [Rhamnella rubrinervis]|uniref:Uncharacterized protein n=1 Tax=Rhamnella rubrinervis TaxID=2594499 RepID=A0A8K0MTP1_9ROSA|nr:hypothetical protein FNV43_RR02316 [Rhamnella rubrinervis]